MKFGRETDRQTDRQTDRAEGILCFAHDCCALKTVTTQPSCLKNMWSKVSTQITRDFGCVAGRERGEGGQRLADRQTDGRTETGTETEILWNENTSSRSSNGKLIISPMKDSSGTKFLKS